MVQADAARNYYADLHVAASADETEIRKAFRKLALQYHPDRNPGREADFVTKFQLIQAAHEVLSDPGQRAKYDQDRRKYQRNLPTPYASNPPRPRPQPAPPRSSYTTAPSGGSYYRAPPPSPQRPTPPQRPAAPHHSSTYTTGADRFSGRNFRPPPTAQRPNTRSQEAEAAKEKANAYTAWQKMHKNARAEEPRTPNAKDPNVNNPNGAPFGRSQSSRTPSSKKGFNPAHDGGDEGQARSSYRSNYDRPVPSAPRTDPLFHDSDDDVPNVPYSEGNRVRTPYASTAGERTSKFGEGVGRSASARSSPTSRPRSATESGAYSKPGPDPKPARFPQGFAQMSSSSDSESEAEVFVTRSKATPRFSASQQNKTHVPFGAAPATSPFMAPPATSPFGGPRSTSPQATPKPFHSRSEESINMKFSPSDWHGKFQSNAGYFASPKGKQASGKTSPSRGREPLRSSSQRPPFPESQPPPPASSFAVPPTSQSTRMPFPPPPSVPNGTAPAPQPAAFAPDVWAKTFLDPKWAMPPPPSGPPPSKAPSSEPPPPTASVNDAAEPAPPPVKFNQETWAGTFQSATFAMPQMPPPPAKGRETSPRRGTAATKRPKATSRKPSAAPEATPAEKKPEVPLPKYQAFPEASNSPDVGPDVDAMDIDTATPPVEKPQPLRTGSTYQTGTPIKFSSPPPQKTGGATGSPNGATSAPSSASKAESKSGLNGLAGLRNVEPMLPSNGAGLSGLDDLVDTLPFASKSSGSHPTKPNSAQKIKYPEVPVPPPVPTVLHQVSVSLYFKKMEYYVREFRRYSQKMNAHFTARDTELEDLDADFCSNRGETTRKWGFASYLKKIHEDKSIMETWNVAQEMHIKAMLSCEEVRNKTLKSYAQVDRERVPERLRQAQRQLHKIVLRNFSAQERESKRLKLQSKEFQCG